MTRFIVGHRETIFQPVRVCCRIPADHFAAMFPGAQAALISARTGVERQSPR
jgi:hypothetical protein